MLLRQLRWTTACLLAISATLAAPSLSKADISITVNQVDATGAFVSALGTFNSAVGQNSFTINGVATNIFDINSLNSTLTSNGTFGSLTTSFTLTTAENFHQLGSDFPDAGHALQFVITATGANNSFPGQSGSFTNNAGATSAIAGTGGLNNIAGITDVTGNTTVQGITSANSQSRVGDGSVSFPAALTTNGNVANLPSPYSITQTIVVKALPVNANAIIATGVTFSGGASSTVTANAPVPAPGGLVLALIALPILGLRRALRGKKDANPAV